MPANEPARHAGSIALLPCVVLALTTMVVFWPAQTFQFVNFDDGDYVVDNAHVASGVTLEGLKWAFHATHADNWHPLTWLSHMLDTTLFGEGPSGPHFTNILLHSANAGLLLLLLWRMSGKLWRSAFVAALFAIHPLHVESVAWISERKDVLSAFFGILTLLAYERYVHSRRPADSVPPPTPVHGRSPRFWYVLALALFALGLMSKPMLVTLPFVMLLLDHWPLSRAASAASAVARWRGWVLEKVPFFLLSAASCVVTMIAQKNAVQPLEHISLPVRAVNAVSSYVRYLEKTFWPTNLAIPYPHPGYGSARFFFGAVLVNAAIGLMILLWRRKAPYLVTGWLWYFGMLVPVIGFVQVGMQAMADRYTYLPLVGVFIVIAWGVSDLVQRFSLPRRAIGAVAVVVLVSCALRTRNQLSFWQNSETLFAHSIAVTKGNDTAHYNLGTFLYGEGRFNEAIQHFQAALEIRPSYDDALNNLASALAANGNLDDAATAFRQAAQRQPEKADVHYNLANVLVMQSKLEDAVLEYQKSLRLHPNDARTHNNLAQVLLMQGRRDEAIAHFEEALKINPNHENARRQLTALAGQPP